MIRLEHREPVRNCHRFYLISVMPTLFGEWAVVREWRRIGSHGGRLELWFESEAQAMDEAMKRCRQKQRRGYALITLL